MKRFLCLFISISLLFTRIVLVSASESKENESTAADFAIAGLSFCSEEGAISDEETTLKEASTETAAPKTEASSETDAPKTEDPSETADLPESVDALPEVDLIEAVSDIESSPEEVTTDPAHTESTHTDPAHTDSAHPGPAHPDSAHPGSAHQGSAHTDPTHTDPAHTDSASVESAPTDESITAADPIESNDLLPEDYVLEESVENRDSFDLSALKGEEDEGLLREAASYTFNGRYGNQLTGLAKDIYKGMEERYHNQRKRGNYIINFQNPVVYRAAVSDGIVVQDSNYRNAQYQIKYAMQVSQDAFLYDYPDVFWVRTFHGAYNTTFEYSNGSYYGTIKSITLTPQEIYSGASSFISGFDKAVENSFIEIRRSLGTNLDRRSVVKTIHDYVAETLYYYNDWSYIIHSAVCMYKDDRRAVCEGYAKIFKIFCNKFGIPCILVVGQTYNSSTEDGHMWNYVKMDDDKWYLVDVTWDDSVYGVRNNYFLVGNNSSVPNGYTISGERYTRGDFSASGMISFAYPVLQPYAYQSGNGGSRRSVKELLLDRSTLDLRVDKTQQLYATLVPVDATNSKINWSTNNAKVATVNSSGIVTANSVGSCTVTAKSADGGYKKTCKVTVYFKDVGKNDLYADAIY